MTFGAADHRILHGGEAMGSGLVWDLMAGRRKISIVPPALLEKLNTGLRRHSGVPDANLSILVIIAGEIRFRSALN